MNDMPVSTHQSLSAAFRPPEPYCAAGPTFPGWARSSTAILGYIARCMEIFYGQLSGKELRFLYERWGRLAAAEWRTV
jgi:hypothetical protein